jgi:hypothetical protein
VKTIFAGPCQYDVTLLHNTAAELNQDDCRTAVGLFLLYLAPQKQSRSACDPTASSAFTTNTIRNLFFTTSIHFNHYVPARQLSPSASSSPLHFFHFAKFLPIPASHNPFRTSPLTLLRDLAGTRLNQPSSLDLLSPASISQSGPPQWRLPVPNFQSSTCQLRLDRWSGNAF